MAKSQKKLDELVGIFEKTFSDKSFSRSEKKAVSQLLEDDISLSTSQRNFLRGKIFEIAHNGLASQSDQTVLHWLETAVKLLSGLYDHDTSVHFSPGEDCRRAIVEELKQARSSVDICVFTISDDWISAEIFDCHSRGVKVRVVTDDEKSEDRGSDIDKLVGFGIDVRIDNSRHHMHHKFAIFDNRVVLTGSYNWTRSAADHNQENILVTDDKSVVTQYKAEFEKLWDEFA